MPQKVDSETPTPLRLRPAPRTIAAGSAQRQPGLVVDLYQRDVDVRIGADHARFEAAPVRQLTTDAFGSRSITWLFVRMLPSASMMIALPSAPSAGSGRGPSEVGLALKGSVRCAPAGPGASRVIGRGNGRVDVDDGGIDALDDVREVHEAGPRRRHRPARNGRPNPGLPSAGDDGGRRQPPGEERPTKRRRLR